LLSKVIFYCVEKSIFEKIFFGYIHELMLIPLVEFNNFVHNHNEFEIEQKKLERR